MSTHKQALFIGGPRDGEIGDDEQLHGYCRHEICAGFSWVFYYHHSLSLAQAMLKVITGYKPQKTYEIGDSSTYYIQNAHCRPSETWQDSTTTLNIQSILEARHETYLEWREPWPACGPEGNDLDAHVVMRATVHDCINMSRLSARVKGRPTMGDDANHLIDFMVTHWATVVKPEKSNDSKPIMIKDPDESRHDSADMDIDVHPLVRLLTNYDNCPDNAVDAAASLVGKLVEAHDADWFDEVAELLRPFEENDGSIHPGGGRAKREGVIYD